MEFGDTRKYIGVFGVSSVIVQKSFEDVSTNVDSSDICVLCFTVAAQVHDFNVSENRRRLDSSR